MGGRRERARDRMGVGGCIVGESSEEGRVWEKGNLKRGSRGRGDEGVFNGPSPKL